MMKEGVGCAGGNAGRVLMGFGGCQRCNGDGSCVVLGEG